jgi:hypothetical protein
MMLVPLIPETPNSLIQRGQLDAGRAALQEIRGQLYNVDNEFNCILKAAGISNTTKVCCCSIVVFLGSRWLHTAQTMAEETPKCCCCVYRVAGLHLLQLVRNMHSE